MIPQDSKIIIGHTVQDKVNVVCDDRIWRIDFGDSRSWVDLQIPDYNLIENKIVVNNGLIWLQEHLRNILTNFIKEQKN